MTTRSQIATAATVLVLLTASCSATRTPAPVGTEASAAAGAAVTTAPPPAPEARTGACSLAGPVDGYRRADVRDLPVHPRSDALRGAIDPGAGVHPDFGARTHLLVLDRDACRLFETWRTGREGTTWYAGAGAVFDLRSNDLPPDDRTSADAAGLPIAPALVRYEEVATGRIDHVLRFTVRRTSDAHVWPARHDASDDDDPDLPPMGTWVRLRADVDVSGLGPQARVVAEAMRRHGMLLSDNGSDLFVTGEPDPRWDDDDLRTLQTLTVAAFEVVDTAALLVDPSSGRVR